MTRTTLMLSAAAMLMLASPAMAQQGDAQPSQPAAQDSYGAQHEQHAQPGASTAQSGSPDYGAKGSPTTQERSSPAPYGSQSAQPSDPQAKSGLREQAQVELEFYNVQPADMRASDLIGMTVYNANNDRIGEIEDLIIDDGKNLQAVILGVGGFLGVGERNVAVEPSSILIQRQADGDERAVVNATKENLERAPEFKMAQAGRR